MWVRSGLQVRLVLLPDLPCEPIRSRSWVRVRVRVRVRANDEAARKEGY